MKYVSSKEFSEMLKQHKQETKVAHKKKLYNKITKEVKNLSMENNDRRKILNNYQRFLKKQSGGVYTKEELKYTIDLGKYNDDIDKLTEFVSSDNPPKIVENDINCPYLKKIMDSINDQSDFFEKIKATQIKNTITKHKFNTHGLLLDFLNYWMRYVKNTEKNVVDTTKTKLTKLVEKLVNKEFNTVDNQVPSDLDNLRYFKDVTDDKEKNLCALDNILSVLTLQKTYQAQLVNYNFIQDMGNFLINGIIKEKIGGSTYTGKSTPGYDYEHYKKSYINVILDNLPTKPDATESTLIPIYNSIMNKASTLKVKGWVGTKTIANVTDVKSIPKITMEQIKSELDNLYTVCGDIKSKITTLRNQLPAGGDGTFNANSVKALYHVFSQSALFKEPIESYYAILSNPKLIDKFSDGNKKKSKNGTTPLGKFVEMKGTDKFLSDVIFSKIAIGAYDDPALPNKLTQSAYQGWDVQGQVPPTATVPTGANAVGPGVQQKQQQTGGPTVPTVVQGGPTDKYENNHDYTPIPGNSDPKVIAAKKDAKRKVEGIYNLINNFPEQLNKSQEQTYNDLVNKLRNNPEDTNVINQIKLLFKKDIENSNLNDNSKSQSLQELNEFFEQDDIGSNLLKYYTSTSSSSQASTISGISNQGREQQQKQTPKLTPEQVESREKAKRTFKIGNKVLWEKQNGKELKGTIREPVRGVDPPKAYIINGKNIEVGTMAFTKNLTKVPEGGPKAMTREPAPAQVNNGIRTHNQVKWKGNNGLEKSGTIQSKVTRNGKLKYKVGTNKGIINVNAEKIKKKINNK